MTDPNDMPNHQRHDDTDAARAHRVQAIVESSGAKLMARIIAPAVIAFFGLAATIIGFFAVRTLNDVVDNQKSGAKIQAEQGRDLTAVKSDVRVLSTRFDEVALRQVTSNTADISLIKNKDVEQDRRLDAFERVLKTP